MALVSGSVSGQVAVPAVELAAVRAVLAAACKPGWQVQPARPGQVEMSSFADEEGLHVCLTARDRAPAAPGEDMDPESAEAILNTLVTHAELERDASGVYGVRMTLPRKE